MGTMVRITIGNHTGNVQRYLRLFAVILNPIKKAISHNHGRFWCNQRFESAYLHHLIVFGGSASSPPFDEGTDSFPH